LKRPWVGRNVDGVLLEGVERDDFERQPMRGCKDDVGRGTGLMRRQPVGCSHTPAITGHEPRKSILRHRRDQVVADAQLVLEELGGDNGADRVAPKVLRTGVAASITKESGNRVGAADRERSPQDVDVTWLIAHETDLGRR
jgi:hypothetical protein